MRQCERGAIAVTVVLLLPVFLVVLGLVADAGYLFIARRGVQVAADMGALAGVQALDLDLLATGEIHLIDSAAKQTALAYAQENLTVQLADITETNQASISVHVYNPGEGTVRHQQTGRLLVDPTVAVSISVPIRLHFTGWIWPEVTISARADASVMEREGF
ncbi:MAG TPA: hypothetical protein GXZ96_00635 [Firmicutes bacterium]|jgi:uncharacterized membrane protein|nr:hypothetical protein [Bacillota bacterium]